MKALLLLSMLALTAPARGDEAAPPRGINTGCDLKSLCAQRQTAYGPNLEKFPPPRVSHGRVLESGAEGWRERAKECAEHARCANLDRQRVQGLFQEARTRMIAQVLDGRPESALSPVEKGFLSNLRDVKLADPARPGRCQSYCRQYGMAQLQPGHQACICPRTEVFADEHLLFILAHEVAHVVDVCARPRDVKSYDANKHPWSPLMACLQANGIQGAQADTGVSTLERTDDAIREAFPRTGKALTWPGIRVATGGLALLATRAGVESTENPHCWGPLGASHMQEAMADELAFRVLGDFLQEHPFAEADRGVAAPRTLGFMLRDACDPDDQHSPFDHHPSAKDRIYNLALARPQIRAALGCSGHTNKLDCARTGPQPRAEAAAPSAPPTDARD